MAFNVDSAADGLEMDCESQDSCSASNRNVIVRREEKLTAKGAKTLYRKSLREDNMSKERCVTAATLFQGRRHEGKSVPTNILPLAYYSPYRAQVHI